MRRVILRVLLLAALPPAMFASTSSVTATVTDTDGQTWSNGAWSAKLVLPSGPFVNVLPTIAGATVPTRASGVLNASGAFAATLTDTSSLDQAGGQWTITVCPNASITSGSSTGCVSVTTAIFGPTVNLSARFSGVTAPRFPPGPNAFGYLDIEVLQPAQPGDSYYNTGTNAATQGLRLWDGKQWSGVGATGVTRGGFGATFDGGGSALAVPKTVYVTAPYACTISGWNITSDTGTATVDVWKVSAGAALPTSSNSITASATPAIATGNAVQSTNLTGWTTSVSANDILGINLKTVSGATLVNLGVNCQ